MSSCSWAPLMSCHTTCRRHVKSVLMTCRMSARTDVCLFVKRRQDTSQSQDMKLTWWLNESIINVEIVRDTQKPLKILIDISLFYLPSDSTNDVLSSWVTHWKSRIGIWPGFDTKGFFETRLFIQSVITTRFAVSVSVILILTYVRIVFVTLRCVCIVFPIILI